MKVGRMQIAIGEALNAEEPTPDEAAAALVHALASVIAIHSAAGSLEKSLHLVKTHLEERTREAYAARQTRLKGLD
jgi:hypothetical protein